MPENKYLSFIGGFIITYQIQFPTDFGPSVTPYKEHTRMYCEFKFLILGKKNKMVPPLKIECHLSLEIL